jgi:hypothetical protein
MPASQAKCSRTNQPVRGRVADGVVEGRAAPEIAEQERHAADRHLVAGAEHLVGEQVAERLERGHPVGGERVLDPVPLLDHQGPAVWRGVAQHGPPGGCRRAGRDPVVRQGHGRETLAVVLDLGLGAGLQRAQAVGAGRCRDLDLALLAGLEGEMGPDMGRGHRTEQAELAALDRPDGRRRAEGQLDVA